MNNLQKTVVKECVVSKLSEVLICVINLCIVSKK